MNSQGEIITENKGNRESSVMETLSYGNVKYLSGWDIHSKEKPPGGTRHLCVCVQ